MNTPLLTLAAFLVLASSAYAQVPGPVPVAPPLEGTPSVGVSPASAPPVLPPSVGAWPVPTSGDAAGNSSVTVPTTVPAAAPTGPSAPVASAATVLPPVPPPVFAQVLSVTAIPQPVMGSRLVCSDAVEVPAATTGAGALVGALVGAAVGSQVGSGSGTALATAAGIVGGAVVGDKAEQGGRTQTARRCVTQSGPSVAYQVVYEYAGQQYSATLPYHPGATVQVQVAPVVPQAPVIPAAAAPVTSPIVISPYSYGWAVPSAALVVGVHRGWGRYHYGGWRGHHRRWRH